MFEIKIGTTSGGLTTSLSPKELSEKAQAYLSQNAKLTLPQFGFLENGMSYRDSATGKMVKVDPPQNAYRDWKNAQRELVKSFNLYGLPVKELDGFRRLWPEEAEDLQSRVQDHITKYINPLRDDLIQDLPNLIDLLVSREDNATAEEIRRILLKDARNFDPTIEPPQIWRNLCTPESGLVMSSDLEQAVVQTELCTRKNMVNGIDKAIIELLEKVAGGVKRLNTQGESAERLERILGPAIREFSESPDTVKRFEQALKVLKDIPFDPQGIKSKEAQDLAKQGLSIFTQTEQAQPTPIGIWEEDEYVSAPSAPEVQPERSSEAPEPEETPMKWTVGVDDQEDSTEPSTEWSEDDEPEF